MTEENYEYRTSQLMLRNAFHGDGKWQIPIIPKFRIQDGDFRDLLLIGFDRAKANDEKYRNRMVHFFLYDYKFERVWKQPDADLERLSKYRAVLSPDFSMYLEMNLTMQLYNTFRNRWCGAYWASKGIRVIPTVNWGDESTYEFCFRGIEKGSAVAVSTYMSSEHNNHSDQKAWFMAGYNEMLRQIEPEKIICYNTPFPEMEGDIVFADYELSSWKYMSYERGYENEDLDCYKIGGAKVVSCDIMEPYRIGKGGGSAFGGKWRPNPNKPRDQRLVGNPGQVNQYGNSETHIGSDGYGDYERHNTDHGNPSVHTNPHDHSIDWSNGFPDFSDPINYPGVAPDFSDVYGGGKSFMNIHYVKENTPEQNRFESISDFKWSMRCGGEAVFLWRGKKYGVVRYGLNNKITVYEAYNEASQVAYDSADDALEYMVGEDRLRDVITQVTVIERTI